MRQVPLRQMVSRSLSIWDLHLESRIDHHLEMRKLRSLLSVVRGKESPEKVFEILWLDPWELIRQGAFRDAAPSLLVSSVPFALPSPSLPKKICPHVLQSPLSRAFLALVSPRDESIVPDLVNALFWAEKAKKSPEWIFHAAMVLRFVVRELSRLRSDEMAFEIFCLRLALFCDLNQLNILHYCRDFGIESEKIAAFLHSDSVRFLGDGRSN